MTIEEILDLLRNDQPDWKEQYGEEDGIPSPMAEATKTTWEMCLNTFEALWREDNPDVDPEEEANRGLAPTQRVE